MKKNIDHLDVMPPTMRILPVEGIMPLPHIIFQVMLREEKHHQLINDALKTDKTIGVFAKILGESPDEDDDAIFDIGVSCSILKIIQSGDGSTRVLLRGLHRISIDRELETKLNYRIAIVKKLNEIPAAKLKAEAYVRNISDLFQRIISISPIFPEEIQDVIFSIEDPSKLSDLIASSLNIQISEKYDLLKELNIAKRLDLLVKALQKEFKIIELNAKINEHVNKEVNRQQREFLLREQLEAIKKELGESDEDDPDVVDMNKKLDKASLTKEAVKAVEKEIERLALMSPYSSEYTVSKTYIDWMLDLPWGKYTEDQLNINEALEILNDDHYGLDDVKDRILEFLSVLKLKKNAKSPILCLVGPPGVGKTSIGKSVARTMHREFIRFSVGGMRDEAEIRGHRRTYIGSMPGRIIQYIKKCGSQNPVIMLDEVDKIGADFRGDPASALLEVLDPEQNKDFRDNYLECAFDLSKVFFIATANSTHSIPPALLDRMELISMPGYITPEKVQIAKQFLVPRQIEQNGLTKKRLRFAPKSIEAIIEHYTMEAGVRSLEREIAKVCRKSAREFAEDEKREKIILDKENIEQFLGPKKIFKEKLPTENEVGIVVGLAYTQSGGDVLPVEVNLMPGKGNFKTTGLLGDVMKESVETAISFLRASAEEFEIEPVQFMNQDIHIHFPAAAIPKDGPSAGVTITTALLSCLTGRKVKHNVAMTGEISLRGRVLPIGGVREKLTAAKRMKIKTVILPKANQSDLDKVPEMVKKGISFVFVDHFRDIVNRILLPNR
ncbi:MAG: endopeptidase La [Candidatus Marinimicrobia bacterium]|nr:endopeptidase La [Candidatus Neomarinimicrobiota bacterium]